MKCLLSHLSSDEVCFLSVNLAKSFVVLFHFHFFIVVLSFCLFIWFGVNPENNAFLLYFSSVVIPYWVLVGSLCWCA